MALKVLGNFWISSAKMIYFDELGIISNTVDKLRGGWKKKLENKKIPPTIFF